MLEDIKAIAELEPNGIISHSCFYFFYTNCIISVFRRCSLTRVPASLYKMPIIGQLQKSIQVIFTRNFNLFFYFSVLFCKNVQWFIFDICIWKMIVAHKHLHKKQKTITRNSRNRENKKCQTRRLLCPVGIGIESCLGT